MKSKHALLLGLAAGMILVLAVYEWRAQLGLPAQSTPKQGVAARSDQDREPDAPSDGFVKLTESQQREFGIEAGKAGPGRLRIEVLLPGEVALNADRVAHVVPRVSGVVREVRKNLGDTVRSGEVVAVLESRELADSTAAVLAARERVTLAQSNFDREEQVWRKKISPEQDYIQAKNKLAEANIELRTAEQKLRALGFNEDYISQLSSRPDKASIIYEMVAPFDATVIEKHISLGEVLKEESPAFLIADLSTVWVNLDVHQKDLPLVRVGQFAEIGIGPGLPSVSGKISFLEPLATETNRTIHARVAIPNAEGRYRPGLFVSGRIDIDDPRVPVLVSNESLVIVDGKTCIFTRENDGFRLCPVKTGRANESYSEITEGLEPGQIYVTRGAFTLKSELQKPEAEK
jgi:membrane fusion protein, heavy metal efflux system